MYNSDNLNDMIAVLEQYKYEYTKYYHANGCCAINSTLLLNQLKLNEQEIRAKAIDEFIKRLYKIGENREFDWEDIYRLADQLKGGAK